MEQFWFNTKTQQVEIGPQSLSLYRIGPFSSYEEASRAQEIVADKAKALREEEIRNEEWD